MARRQFSNTATQATLTASIDATTTSFALTSFAGYPPVPYTATISRGQTDEEVVLVTAVSASTVTVTRGYDSTSAKAHSAGATFLHTTIAKDFDEANAHVNATSGVHGVVGSVVGTTDTQTLTNKSLTSPALSSPTWSGTASGDALSLTGALGGTTGSFSGTVAAAAATAAGHLVRKDQLDPVDTRLATAETTLAAATSAATANALTKRDASGNATYNAVFSSGAQSTVASALTRKDYVDTADTNLANRVTALEANPGWTDVATFTNGWINYGAPFVVARYRKRADGVVELQGLIKAGTNDAAAFVLPAGFRPSGTLMFAVNCNSNEIARLDVDTNGNVIPRIGTGGGTNAYLALNCSFRADA